MKVSNEIVDEYSKIYKEYNNKNGLKMRQALKKAVYSLTQYTDTQKDILWGMILAKVDKDLKVKIK